MTASTLAAALAEAHGPALRAWFRRATGRPDIADDLAQEVFLRVVRFADGYEARGCDRAWLFTIAHRVLVDHVRSVTRLGGAPVALDAAHGDHAGGGAAAPMQEVRLILQRALAALDGTDRDAFLMAEVAGLSYAEIGVVLDMSHAAVRSRVYRARLALRTVLVPPAAAPPRKGATP
jgi:RNA polymerase sigma-70 factor (ECF subfamily)